MTRPVVPVDAEFEIMADYQLAIESRSVIVENALEDPYRYSLYSIETPYPTYDEYRNGNDFDEDKLLMESNTRDDLKLIQQQRRSG